jgi:hypothetical protein
MESGTQAGTSINGRPPTEVRIRSLESGLASARLSTLSEVMPSALWTRLTVSAEHPSAAAICFGVFVREILLTRFTSSALLRALTAALAALAFKCGIPQFLWILETVV